MAESLILIIPLLIGYLLDLLLGDPPHWPHPVKLFGHLINYLEKAANRGSNRFFKGALCSLILCIGCGLLFHFLLQLSSLLSSYLTIFISSVLVFFGLANRNLIDEGKAVFREMDFNGLEAGRKRLSWIVGRDTSHLNPQQIRTAVFETMSENLSDGVIAPLFYYFIGGIPAMMTYKMINTLDSMIGYRNERYEQFGKFAARLDDVANFIPARLTALLMIFVSGSARAAQFVFRFGNQHKSPNSGYPEAALAGILNCRFGGPNTYKGITIEKPFIGENERELSSSDLVRVVAINQRTTLLMVIILCILTYLGISI